MRFSSTTVPWSGHGPDRKAAAAHVDARARSTIYRRSRRLYSSVMSVLAPTPPDRLVDERGRPYFAWDEDLTLSAYRVRLRDPDPDVRAYFLGKLMRQAKPDDVFSFVTLDELIAALPAVAPYLGKTRAFWTWLLTRWAGAPDGPR